MSGATSVSKFKNQAPRVSRKVRGALGNTLVSFTNKINSRLQINIYVWHEKLVAWELSIHEFSIREKAWVSYEKQRLEVRRRGVLRIFVEGR
ncbi:hypothetical protein Pyn_16045 [Prunus yedoensis var. nudiflora]|uniref:Uncharacterized protein n=1 Tax=Prunus yedoensis var. nudiflora TaxID=2094558 RepID=A0A314U9M2_PRUYE|nr:hypothetical protein Pyn_16045 [Prunus yedoensis var. nudiflora]